jgi:hypothetical protein
MVQFDQAYLSVLAVSFVLPKLGIPDHPQSATPLLPWLYVPAILIKAHVFTSLPSTTTITASTFRGKVIFLSPWPAVAIASNRRRAV